VTQVGPWASPTARGPIGEARRPALSSSAEAAMLGLIAILVVLWLLGVITKNTFGGVLHILLVVAIIFLLIRVIRGRPV
jgi:hypothetical protein